jgi:hypothetical protein
MVQITRQKSQMGTGKKGNLNILREYFCNVMYFCLSNISVYEESMYACGIISYHQKVGGTAK